MFNVIRPAPANFIQHQLKLTCAGVLNHFKIKTKHQNYNTYNFVVMHKG